MPNPTPCPDPEAQAYLDEVAAKMIAEATSDGDPRVFSASGFARENISILHQQIRATNLAWALGHARRVEPGTVVGIVGGSFSGLTLAIALALASDAIIYLFEREDRLLPRFRDKAHRHLSPVLNTRFLGEGFDPNWSSPHFRSPVFEWDAGRASEVASRWLQEFETRAAALPIFVLTGQLVHPEMILSDAGGLRIDLSANAGHLRPVQVDLLIDATGFGEERNPLAVTDFSYWDSGHRLIYDHLLAPADVLVSGCGDSGVIEGLHYAIRDFRHEQVERLWLGGEYIEMFLDEGLGRARFDDVLKGDWSDAYDGKVISEICWWLDRRRRLRRWDQAGSDGTDDDHVRPIFDALERTLRPLFENAGRARYLAAVSPEELEEFATALPLAVQLAVRNAVAGIVDHWSSLRIAKMAEEILLPEGISELHALAREGVRIVLNGTTPTAYTRQLSSYNVWVMRLLLSFPNVEYLQGKIDSVAPRSDRRFNVMFEGGGREVFDRVVTRYGPKPSGDGAIARQAPRDTQAGDWLLHQPEFVVRDGIDPHRGRRHWPARLAVTEGMKRHEDAARSEGLMSKDLYLGRLLLGPDGFPGDDPFYVEPEAWLMEELRAGRRPVFHPDRRSSFLA